MRLLVGSSWSGLEAGDAVVGGVDVARGRSPNSCASCTSDVASSSSESVQSLRGESERHSASHGSRSAMPCSMERAVDGRRMSLTLQSLSEQSDRRSLAANQSLAFFEGCSGEEMAEVSDTAPSLFSFRVLPDSLLPLHVERSSPVASKSGQSMWSGRTGVASTWIERNIQVLW